jgi:hypothetical protein
MPYNLPPNKIFKQVFIFLSLVILGRKEPKKQMNIFLRLLMKEVEELWRGVDAYDSYLKCQFNLCPAYLWSIHDYLAYDKFVGWCVQGQLNYPVCMDDSIESRLEHDRKVTFFDCHQRFLPLNHPFRSDKLSFLKSKSVRNVQPKQKLIAGITKMLDGLNESENGEFECYSEKHN